MKSQDFVKHLYRQIKTYLQVNGVGTPVELDNEMSDTSEGIVKNKVIKAYVDNAVSSGGSSIPAGYSPMQIEMVDSNGVTHTYEFLGKEITP